MVGTVVSGFECVACFCCCSFKPESVCATIGVCSKCLQQSALAWNCDPLQRSGKFGAGCSIAACFGFATLAGAAGAAVGFFTAGSFFGTAFAGWLAAGFLSGPGSPGPPANTPGAADTRRLPVTTSVSRRDLMCVFMSPSLFQRPLGKQAGFSGFPEFDVRRTPAGRCGWRPTRRFCVDLGVPGGRLAPFDRRREGWPRAPLFCGAGGPRRSVWRA